MNLHFSYKKIIPDIILTLLLIAYTAGSIQASRHTSYYDIYKLSGKDSISFEKGVITAITNEKIKKQETQKGLITGFQDLSVLILTGKYKGQTVSVTNYINYDTNFYFKKGNHLIVTVNATSTGKTLHVFVSTPNRLPVMFIFSILIVLLLCIAGGRQGYRAVLAIIFTISSILFVFIPLVYNGIQPTGAAFILAVVTACITLPLISGIERKTAIAIIGTIVCVCISAGIQAVFCKFAHVSSFTYDDTDSLMQIAAHSKMQIGGLLFASVLISSLGAVMDIAISIASAINEVHLSNSSAKFSELFAAGMHIGRDMMGTMANTLILAFTGSSIVSLIQIYTYNMNMNQVLNSNGITIEIIQSLTGCFAVISAVPIVSAISARTLLKQK